MFKGSGFHNEASLCSLALIRYFIVKDEGLVTEPFWGTHRSQWLACLLRNSSGIREEFLGILKNKNVILSAVAVDLNEMRVPLQVMVFFLANLLNHQKAKVLHIFIHILESMFKYSSVCLCFSWNIISFFFFFFFKERGRQNGKRKEKEKN